MKRTRIIISILISFLMILSGFCEFSNYCDFVYAADSPVNGIVFGTENISNTMIDSSGTSADSHIWFGNKANLNGNNSRFAYGAPYWRVLDARASNGTDNNSSGVSGRMFLMSEYSWASGGYVGYGFGSSNIYQNSSLQDTLNSYIYNGGLFSTIEKNAIVAQEKNDEAGSVYNSTWQGSNLTDTDYLFSLSVFELKKYISSRASTTDWDSNRTDPNLVTHVGSDGRTNAEAAAKGPSTRYPGWWLRTPQGIFAGVVSYTGFVGNDIVSQNNAIRPALNLDLSRVVFITSASGGKQSESIGQSSLKYVSANKTNDWKLTLFDDSRAEFSIGSITKDVSNNTIAFSYSGAIVGSGEYLSAMVIDSENNVKYYGRILDLENGSTRGTAIVDISRCYTSPQDKLYIINEHYNGDYLSDYSSNLCDAGNLFEHTVSHSLNEVERTEPTCTETGNIGYWECSACGRLFADENSANEINLADTVLPANGHSLQRIPAVEPTCLTDGNIEHWKCTVCSLLFKDSQGEVLIKKRYEYILDAIGHSWNEWEYYDDTLHHRICNNDITHEETGEHDWATYYIIDTEPTCEREGSKSIHCTICLASKPGTEETVPTIDHSYGDWTITKDVTCTTDGLKEKTCAVCGDKVIEEIPSQGHIYSDEYAEDLAPTCTAEGSKSKHCVNCGEMDESTITSVPALGHSYGDWEDITPNTCVEAGVHQHSCTVCGYTESEATDLKGHDVEDHYTIDVPATCTTDGSQSKHCSRCDAVFDSEVITATGHSYDGWVTTKEATCTENGSKEETCSKCGDKITEEIPAKGHAWNNEPTIDKPATCTENGSQSTHCARCKETKDAEVITALGHSWNTTPTIDKKPTCTADGSESIHCSRCDAVKDGSKSVVAKTGHKFSAWTTTKKATELAAGQQTRKCSACGKTETKTIAQLKPSLPAVKIAKPKAAKKAATIKWTKVSKKNQKKIAKIQIQYSTDKTFKTGVKTVYAKKSTASKKITKLTSKKTYYVRIRAYKSSGGVVHVSKWSAVKSMKAK